MHPYFLYTFLSLYGLFGATLISVGLFVHNMIALGIGCGMTILCLGLSLYIFITRQRMEKERQPLLVDFVY